jgi:hypothetical protein
VVASKDERERTAPRRVRHTTGYELARVVDLGQKARSLVAQSGRLGDSRLHIAFVSNLVAQALESLLETGIADRRRAHVDTAAALAKVERGADDGDLPLRLRSHCSER